MGILWVGFSSNHENHQTIFRKEPFKNVSFKQTNEIHMKSENDKPGFDKNNH